MMLKLVILGAALGLFCAAPADAKEYAWGAIAIDASVSNADPAYGVGGGDSESEAVENAHDFCIKAGGGKGCKSMVTYRECGAFASNGGEAGWGKAATKQTAENGAMDGCGKKNCKIVISDCN
jgi:hypothetical protein